MISNCISRYVLKELKAGTQTDTWKLMFLAELFMIAKRYTQPKFSLTDKRISKVWHIHKMKRYWALKGSEIMNLKYFMLREIWHRRTNVTSTYKVSRRGKFIQTEDIIEVTWGWVKRRLWSYCLVGSEFLFEMKKSSGNGSDGCTILWMYLMLLNSTLKMVKITYILLQFKIFRH